jgi:glutamate dehydrogenase (NADP+)
MLKTRGETLKGKVCAVSGSGNVAQYTVEKLNQLGAKVVTLSDSDGYIHDDGGIDQKELACVMDLKNVRRGRIKECANEFKCKYHEGKRPWSVKCDIAFPSATQNEISGEDAKMLVKNGCIAVGEGANMPTDLDGVHVFKAARILYAPGKASNAGGVAVSGLEMSQNSARMAWKEAELQEMLKDIMKGIHDRCLEYGRGADGHTDYVKGANIGGFKKVADAMLAFGVV